MGPGARRASGDDDVVPKGLIAMRLVGRHRRQRCAGAACLERQRVAVGPEPVIYLERLGFHKADTGTISRGTDLRVSKELHAC